MITVLLCNVLHPTLVILHISTNSVIFFSFFFFLNDLWVACYYKCLSFPLRPSKHHYWVQKVNTTQKSKADVRNDCQPPDIINNWRYQSTCFENFQKNLILFSRKGHKNWLLTYSNAYLKGSETFLFILLHFPIGPALSPSWVWFALE